MTNTTDTHSAATLLHAIYATWSDIGTTNPDLPRVTVTLASGNDGKGIKLGHFAPSRWTDAGETTHELFIGGEGLDRGPEGLLATILHEAAHALCHVRGVKDTSRQGRYHNTKFRVQAEKLGLTVTQDAKLGWSPSELTEQARDAYETTLGAIADALTLSRLRQKGPDEKPKTKPGFSATHEHRGQTVTVRMSRKQFENTGILICGLCFAETADPSDTEQFAFQAVQADEEEDA